MDYAKAANMARWLRHPVMGDPSFDTFEKIGDTVHVSEYPYEWTVNGSLFIGKDGAWYLYAGLYSFGYLHRDGCASHFEIYKSLDRGHSWQWLGRGLDDNYVFEGETAPSSSCPDAVLFYDDKRGRYLLSYDWSTVNSSWDVAHNYAGTTADSGAAVAWADSPEGPFERVARPVFRNRQIAGNYGRFNRFYATSVIPRKHDYLALILCDTGPNFAWALAGCTAAAPEEGFSDPVMLLNADLPTYYPAPMEFYPAFVVGDTVYAPATSVCANRNYQVLFSAPLEEAHKPTSWRMAQDGSLWHARPLDDERHGIFGQTFNGMVDEKGMFNVMYPSKDPRNWGTVSVASRRWDEPLSDGFTLSGHAAPSVTLLRDAYEDFALDAAFDLHGGFVDFLFDFHGMVGPEYPVSDCAPCPESLKNYTALRVSGNVWSLVRNDALLLTGRANGRIASVRLARQEGRLRAWADGQLVCDIDMPSQGPKPVGIRVDRFTVLNVTRFDVTGQSELAALRYNDADALLGGGVGDINFTVSQGIRRGGSRVKWNVICSKFTLMGRTAPGCGRAIVRVDGAEAGTVCFDGQEAGEVTLFTSQPLPYGPHGIELIPVEGEIIVPHLIAL